MKPSGPLKGPRSPTLIGGCAMLPLPLLFPLHAASSKEISRKRSSAVRLQDEVVDRYMCFLLMHSQTFVVLDSLGREWSVFSGRFFLPQESAANALIKRPYRSLLKTNDRNRLVETLAFVSEIELGHLLPG